MKKIPLIATISGIVLLIFITWGYLFIYGTPESAEELFATFGIVGGDRETEFESDPLVDTTLTGSDGSVQSLRQLTTSPVAGMVFLDSDTVQYVERGTGHIYAISLSSGVETQVTNTTHTKIIDAELSSSGTRAIYETETDNGIRTSVGTIVKIDSGEGTVQNFILPQGAYDAEFSDSGTEVYYLLPTSNGSEAHTYSVADRTDRVLFSIPFSAAHASWGTPTYIYTKPTASLLGYVYEVSGNALKYVRSGGFGLTAFAYGEGVITTEVSDGRVETFAYGEATYQIPLEIFPEKCVVADGAPNTLLCAASLALGTGVTYPDDWYKGITSFEDMLWEVDIENEEAVLLFDPLSVTGRALDVAKITANADGSAFLLINKNDNTLWLFEPSL